MSPFSRSFLLVKESFAVLKKDKELLLFPLFSGVFEIILIIAFWVPPIYFFLKSPDDFFNGYTLEIIFYLLLFLFYLMTYFIINFFNFGLIFCAYTRLNGGNPTFKGGVTMAFQHLDKIFLWSMVSATIGIILKIIGDKTSILGKIAVSVVHIAWNLVTYLIIPILLFENKGIKASIKESETLFKKTWGEQIVGNFSMGFFFGLLLMFTFIPMIIAILIILSSAQRTNGFVNSGNTLEGFPYVPILGLVAIMVIYGIVLSIIRVTLEGIFTTALYMYARTATIPSSFSSDVIKQAFIKK